MPQSIIKKLKHISICPSGVDDWIMNRLLLTLLYNSWNSICHNSKCTLEAKILMNVFMRSPANKWWVSWFRPFIMLSKMIRWTLQMQLSFGNHT
jgi:hypothetical protein